MGQISDSLWEIIRSEGGMRSEITETVQSVYDKLANPLDRKSTRLNSSHLPTSRMPSSA